MHRDAIKKVTAHQPHDDLVRHAILEAAGHHLSSILDVDSPGMAPDREQDFRDLIDAWPQFAIDVVSISSYPLSS